MKRVRAAAPTYPRLFTPASALVMLFLGMLATTALFLGIRALEQDRAQAEFARRAGNRIEAIRQALEQAVELLSTINRFVATAQPAGNAQFEAFTAPLLKANAHIGLMAFQRVVHERERPAFEAERRARFPGFTITELAGGKTVPAARRAQYRVVELLAPLPGNEQLLGFDAASRIGQQEAARRACTTGLPSMAPQSGALVDNALRPRLTVFMPVYRAPGPAGSGGADCTRVAGYTVLVLSSAALVERTLAARNLLEQHEFRLSVYAGRAPDPRHLVFRSGAPGAAAPGWLAAGLASAFNARPAAVAASFDVAGQPWHIAVAAAPAPLLQTSLSSLLMLVWGSVVSMLVSACIGVRAAHGRKVHLLVRQRTAALTLANESLRLRRHEEELAYHATHDALTGLANRKLLRERLQHETAAAARDLQSVWIVFLDLDGFKRVNDRLGHRAGDEFLKTIAQRLAAAVRPGDTVARLGGDEFMLVLPERCGGALSNGALERIMAVVGMPVTIDSHEFFLSCSAGIANFPGDGIDPDALVEYADLAMYRARERGRNNFQHFEPEMNRQAQDRLQLERALRGALERAEFELHYQPQVDLRTGRMVGVEALLRWRHPELGLVAPLRFIALAEETGLIVPIGAWVMRTACAQVLRWQQSGWAALRLALNLAARQLNEPDLVASVAQILEETGFPANCLELELTETLVMSDMARTVEVLNGLHDLGLKLSVDDFGTGYSSLAHLKRFPIDVLKIDQSFVREISDRSNEAAISDAIISMAHTLGMRVIAEGVETEAQCEFLSRNMCDEMQGFLFSEALPAAAMEALLAQARCLPDHLLRMHKRAQTLLLVDDEPNILAALRRQLRGAGYRILTAPGGAEGLALLASEEIDVIVSDQRMPGMTGVEFLRMVKNLHPETVRMVLSGFTELQSVTDAVNEGAIYKFLTKPWDDTQLRGHIEEAFQLKQLADENRRLDLEVRTANHGLARANRQLGDVLRQQQEQIDRDGISLGIVREALQHVPLPIIGIDDDEVVAFANLAGQALFREFGLLLGNPADQFMPGTLFALRQVAQGQSCTGEIGGERFSIASHSMGKGTRSRGQLIIFTPSAAAAAAGSGNSGREQNIHK